jgi:hypothetical protein
MSFPLAGIKVRIHRMLNPYTINKLVRYRIPICIFIAIFIVLFALFGLSDDRLFTGEFEEIKNKLNIESNSNLNSIKNNQFDDSNFITDFPTIENLIILPCHSVFAPELNSKFEEINYNNNDNSRFSIVENKNNWLMEPFQAESDDNISFLKHLELSLLELNENIKDSALVISGGFTKSEIQKSESSSYLELAKSVGFLKNPYFRINTNILLEEYARDSYENVLYSICTFVKRFNKFPKKITIIGFGFKRERFLSSHLTTLGYYILPNLINANNNYNLPNTNHVKYIGAGPFIDDLKENFLRDDEFEQYKIQFWDSLNENEKNNALNLFQINPFGSKDSLLHEKKVKRDPWNKHKEVSFVYNMKNEILDSLIEIDQLNFSDAWKLYKFKVLPNFPLYEQLYS